MDQFVLALAVVTPLFLGAGVVLVRHRRRRASAGLPLSAVSRQHIDLVRGKEMNADALRAATEKVASLLDRGDVAAVERLLRRGLQYVVHVTALAEVGTDDAARVLERQLQRRLSADPVEQAWYWIDVVQALRRLDRAESLAHALRRAEAVDPTPLGHFFAAEAACFSGFASHLRRPRSPLGRAAARTLCRALAGLRRGVQPEFVVEARVGELVETLWDAVDGGAEAVSTRVFAEALRVLHRGPGEPRDLAPADAEVLRWQLGRLAALRPALRQHLADASNELGARLAKTAPDQQAEILQTLDELQADAAAAVLPLLGDPRFLHAALGARLLRWSRDPRAAAWLRDNARDACGPEVGVACLEALGAHPGAETERVLLENADHRAAVMRRAVAGSLGRCEPTNPSAVRAALDGLRLDRDASVRRAARAALARMGERQALQSFRMGLASADFGRVIDAIEAVASERLVLLWPDLDRLADSGDEDVARCARVALEDLREEVVGRPEV